MPIDISFDLAREAVKGNLDMMAGKYKVFKESKSKDDLNYD